MAQQIKLNTIAYRLVIHINIYGNCPWSHLLMTQPLSKHELATTDCRIAGYRDCDHLSLVRDISFMAKATTIRFFSYADW